MPIGILDYPDARLSMECNNEVEDKYRLRSCTKEPWTMEFINAIPAGAVFWDIGANVGPYALVAAYRNLTVVAVEPGFNNHAAMCRNLAMNNLLDRCFTLCLALGEKPGAEWLHYQDLRQGGANHVMGGPRKEFFHRQLVLVRMLDDLLSWLPLPADRGHYLKLDVDGGELGVLKGAARFLRADFLLGIQVEMQLADEKEMVSLLDVAGWKLSRRIDKRGELSIGEIAYGQFERA